ncbi:MAG TPA: tRNA-dihydrouridine synthase family protein [Bacteroidales bacterium]|nr:tRNA-dihydrouridine synthase family protein [Bacteroidales bacterium]HOH21898.1 tRNA-dihydrouridine synthase family protein [Bacteroidales bacterium]HPB57302.1 tRNA-dihydrouridine synthase family protein [Bacteroidales bacterium]HPZ03179.1 tRNA-dihydrouridine synthase family protein [Bacteroidales bacterium]HQB74574.1 tRNA-dihydrouridine synthase family protein [Bacteroidales bacterium]
MIGNPTFWFAPLHGITYYYMRNPLFIHAQGFDVAVAPFIPAQLKHQINPAKWKDLQHDHNRIVPVIPQLMGNEAQPMLDTIVQLKEKLGYDAVNWNLGCPMNPIVRKKRGCGLMPYPDRVDEILDHIFNSTSVQLSIKMRLGMFDPEEGYNLIQVLNRYPIHFLIIHSRLGIQQYGGVVNWSALEHLIAHTGHEIVYNGDLFEIDTFRQLQATFPDINHWMIGRGVLRNPFLIEELKLGTPLDFELKMKRFQVFYSELESSLFQLKTEQTALPKLKELWHYFAHFFNLNEEQLLDLLRVKRIDEFKNKTHAIVWDPNI